MKYQDGVKVKILIEINDTPIKLTEAQLEEILALLELWSDA